MSEGKIFAASYSGGKDSILAIHRAMQNGYTPKVLLTTFDAQNERSWFHNIPLRVLEQAADALNIPLSILKTEGDSYAPDFERRLSGFKAEGINTCVFGDIDILEHFKWSDERCKRACVSSYFPLWQNSRRDLVHEFIDIGFKAVITVINTDAMDAKYIGRVLTRDLVTELEAEGTDICGEQGEYHTFVYDGPIFAKKVDINFGEMITNGSRICLPLM